MTPALHQPTGITLIGFDKARTLAAGLMQALVEHWPGPESIEFTHRTVSEVLGGSGSLLDAPCLVHVPDNGVGVDLLKLLDQLSIRLLPIVLVGESPAGRFTRLLDRGEFLIWSLDDPVAPLAPQLFALHRRQHTVRRLAAELRLADRSQGGMYGEMSRIEEEMQLAAIIQREMLPRVIPEVNDVRFGVLFRPAGYVSGDAYTVERLDETTVGFFLADAVGHGVPAALMTMVMLRNLRMKEIRGHDYRILPPHEVLGYLNEEMVRTLGTGGRFATGIYGLIDTRTHRVRLANAGHPAPLWFSPSDPEGYRPLRPTGGLLGVFPDQTYDEVEFELAPTERLVVFSDGFEIVTPDWSSKAPRSVTSGLPNQRGPAIPCDDAAAEAPRPRRSIESQYAEFFAEFYGPDLSPGAAIGRLAQRMNRLDGSLHQIDDITALIMGRDAEQRTNIVDRRGEIIESNRSRTASAA